VPGPRLRPPNDQLLQKWRSAVPTAFEFTMKAWQVVTHEASSPTYRRLRDLIDGRPSAYIRFNNLPRVGDADRFIDML